MKEQSHKDEMSAAVRGDFARLRERGVAATLGPIEGSEAVRDGAEQVDREPESVVPEPDDEPAEPSAEADEPSERPGFFGRLLGR